MWSPKTDASARRIPYGWSPRVIATVEDFAQEVGSFNMDASTINRRVDELAERADIDDLYLNALRATTATFWFRRGLELHQIRDSWAGPIEIVRWVRLGEQHLELTGERERTAQDVEEYLLNFLELEHKWSLDGGEEFEPGDLLPEFDSGDNDSQNRNDEGGSRRLTPTLQPERTAT